jgi:aryl sulfotransferase
MPARGPFDAEAIAARCELAHTRCMTNAALSPPKPATRAYSAPIWDPTRWNAFHPRADDIIVATPPKSGTTWMQGILALLISGDPMANAQHWTESAWIDMMVQDLAEAMARLDAQTHRRQIKTHTPFDGIPVWEDLRYITVYRHPIDIHFSFVKHAANMRLDVLKPLFPDDPSERFRIFLEGEHLMGASLWSIVNHYRCTLAREPHENLLRLHYADMLRDLDGAMARVARHIGISHPPDVMAALVAAATFDSMKSNADRFAPSAGRDFWRSDAAFFDSATSSKWEGKLSDADLAAYDARMSSMLTPEERQWLEWGGQGAGD